jgi:single-strand DNA-binding protein
MSSLNKVFLLGRLGKDPDARAMPDGTAVTSFSLATSVISTKSGEKKEYTEWHRCVAFNKAGEVAASYLRKGSLVLIEGSLRTRKYEDKGVEKYTTEVVVGRLTMVGSKPNYDEQQPDTNANTDPSKGFSDLEDDIPF